MPGKIVILKTLKKGLEHNGKSIFKEHDMDFFALYTSVGLWNALYVIMYAVTNATKLMKFSTRSTEEIFALFICIAFTVDAFKDAYSDFKENYLTRDCQEFDELVSSNNTIHSGESS